jgi:hypothetical protein
LQKESKKAVLEDLPCDNDPDSIRVALYLIASDGYSFVAICLSSAVFTRNNRTNCVHDVLETHGQVVENIQVVRGKSRQQYLARQFNIIFHRIQAKSNDALLILVPAVPLLPGLEAICLAYRLYRHVYYDLSL